MMLLIKGGRKLTLCPEAMAVALVMRPKELVKAQFSEKTERLRNHEMDCKQKNREGSREDLTRLSQGAH